MTTQERPLVETAPGATSARSTYLHRWRFAIVLASSLLLAVGQPFFSSMFDEQGVFDVAVSLLVMAVMLLSVDNRKARRIAIWLGLASLIGLWSAHAFHGAANRTVLSAAYLLTASSFAFALGGIVRTILVGQASINAILGAVCGYLLLGIIWSLFYAALETLSPGSLTVAAAEDMGKLDRSALSYFSFVTLSTVGYGDITPVKPLARSLAWIEAVAGQFYLAVLVAGLVGFKVSAGQRSNLSIDQNGA